MIEWIKEKWNSDIVMYRLLFWSHLVSVVIQAINWPINGEFDLNAFMSSLIIAMLSATLIKGIKNDS